MSINLRRLVTLVGAVLAVTAMAAPVASAATEVRDADTEELCSEVQPPVEPGSSPLSFLLSTSHQYESGGCTVHLVGGGEVVASQSECDYSYTARIGPDGWGYVTDVSYSNCIGGTPVSCQGDGIIAPPEYKPMFGSTPYFKYANAATDLNVVHCAYLNGLRWGLTSYDIAVPGDESAQDWSNQQPDAYTSWYHHAGDSVGPEAEEDVLITH